MDSVPYFWYNVLMYLHLKTDRPLRAMSIGMLVLVLFVAVLTQVPVAAMGGPDSSEYASHVLEERLHDLRTEQIVRSRREEILRTQLAAFDDVDVLTDEMRVARDELLELLLDRYRAEDEIAASLRELWDAQDYAQRASRKPSRSEKNVVFAWPVEPTLGVSAHFDDPGYRARFGFAHRAIDIPVNQDSVVRSIADGVVENISDQGMGFNSIVIRHDGGYSSLYGHVTEFLVAEGDEVSLGDPIARSGGMPGTKGAGNITTGPHVHLEMLKEGEHIDPLLKLPEDERV